MNAIVPALIAGNAVILKHSAQTPLVAERFADGFKAAGLPAGVFQVVHLSHADTERLIAAPEIDFVAFTGSVEGGHAVQRAASARFVGTGLELGGKDPAYVRATPISTTPSRILSTAVSSIRGRAAAPSSASTCMRTSTTVSSTGSSL